MNNFALSLLGPLGRLLLAWGFLASGYTKVLAPAATAAYISTGGLPESSTFAVGVGVFELACGAALVVGFKTRWIAALLAAFTLIASLLFHAYWNQPAAQQAVQQLLFTKNVAILGALFLLMAIGGGPWSVDARALRRAFTARLDHAPPRVGRPGAMAGSASRTRAR